jgi:putative SOS response-associated peptidase YedK
MCYSAQIEASYQRYVREFGAHIDIHEYVKVANKIHRAGLDAAKMPKAVGAAFAAGESAGEREVFAAVQAAAQRQRETEQGELAAQSERLEAAVAKLASPKPTKKAADDQRIATKKIAHAQRRIADIDRTELEPNDSRMWPGSYVPVLTMQDGRRVVTPMRYRCRPWFVDEKFEKDRPGTYNARLDSLDGFWRPLFGQRHGIIEIVSFFESVDRGGKATEIQFTPNDGQRMIVPCLWSEWGEGEDRLLSFAIITDEPTSEILAAGHDRRPIQIRPEDVDAWLNPDPANLEAQLQILLRGPRPFYEHALSKQDTTKDA